MTISPDPSVVSLQCSFQRTPIIDPSVKEETEDDKAKKLTKGRKKSLKKFKKLLIPT